VQPCQCLMLRSCVLGSRSFVCSTVLNKNLLTRLPPTPPKHTVVSKLRLRARVGGNVEISTYTGSNHHKGRRKEHRTACLGMRAGLDHYPEHPPPPQHPATHAPCPEYHGSGSAAWHHPPHPCLCARQWPRHTNCASYCTCRSAEGLAPRADFGTPVDGSMGGKCKWRSRKVM